MRIKSEKVRRRNRRGDVTYERISLGSASVKVHEHLDKNRHAVFTLVYHLHGKRYRPTFAHKADALTEAERVLALISNGEVEALTLQSTDRLVYLRAVDALAGIGVPLDLAAREFAQATKALGPAGSLMEAVKYFVKTRPTAHREVPVADAVAELLKTRIADGSSHCHVKDLRSRLTRFAEAFQCPISSISATEVQAFLRGLKLEPRTVNNYRTCISNLFRFARLQNYVPKDHDPVAEVPEWKEPQKPIEILTVAEMRTLLTHADREFLPYLVIAGFAGLRQSEIERLRWEHVNGRHIHIRPDGKQRVKSNRLVPIQPNLKNWLDRLRKPEGPIVPYANPSNVLVRQFRQAGLQNRHNALRHAFASYRLAVLEDAAKVAHEMGNSPGMVYRHYRELVTNDDGAAWFDLNPLPNDASPTTTGSSGVGP